MGNYTSFAGWTTTATVFTDTRLRHAVINTVVLTASVVVISSLLGLALARAARPEVPRPRASPGPC